MKTLSIKNNHQKKPAVAAFLSMILWGSGQFYNGQFLKGCLFIMTNIFILPWVYSIVDAYVTCQKYNIGEIKKTTPRRWYVAILTWIFTAGVTASIFMWIWASVVDLNRYDYNIQAKNHLLEIAVNSEIYAREHSHLYPESLDDLTGGVSPYLKESVCGSIEFGFEYICNFDSRGYRHEARPVSSVLNNSLKEHVIVTGVLFLENQHET